jgi:hypothetical protein
MKKINFIIAVIFFFAIQCFAQTPRSFDYPLFVSDNNGTLLADKNLVFRISVLEGAYDGKIIYRELHNCITDSTGMAIVKIGSGKAETGTYSSITNKLSYFLKIEYKTNKDSNNFIVLKEIPMPDVFPSYANMPPSAPASIGNSVTDTSNKSMHAPLNTYDTLYAKNLFCVTRFSALS